MALINYYPELPIVPYQRTPVSLAKLTQILAAVKAPVLVKRMAYVMLRNESANGASIINNNPAGIQADSGRWSGKHQYAGVVVKRENGTNKLRYFLAFKSLADAVTFVCERIAARQLHVGGTPPKIYKERIDTAAQLADAYIEEWVRGDGSANPSPTELKNFLSMYRQAEKAFV